MAKLHRIAFYKYSWFLILFLLIAVLTPINDALGAGKIITPELTPFGSTNSSSPQIQTVNSKKISETETTGLASAAAADPTVAILTIFADPTTNGTGSSGTDGSSAFGTHAFITISNVSSSNINVGKFSGIAPNRAMSIGTWGNKSEHKGLWYNLEAYFVSKNSAYNPRVSVSYGITATQLSALNSFIINNDRWSTLTNCSSFAVKAWNTIAATEHKLSAGTPNTPKKLADNIKAKYALAYRVGASVPWHYAVYYANGSGSPIRSATYK